MKKTVWCIYLAIFLLLVSSSVALADDTRTSGLYTYTIKGNGTITIVDFDWSNNSGDIYIPTMLDGYNLTGIGARAFAVDGGENVGSETCSVNIPNTITSIGDFAFENANVSFVNIPQSVSFIGNNPFLNCKSLVQISVDPSNATFASIDGVLYQKSDKALLSYPLAAMKKEIPNGIVTISDYSFSGIKDWKNTWFPSTLEVIGEKAFQNATIEAVTTDFLPGSVTEIGENAFADSQIMIRTERYSTSIYADSKKELSFENLDKLFNAQSGVEWQELKLFGANVQRLGIGAFMNAFFSIKDNRLNGDVLLLFLGSVPGSTDTTKLTDIPEGAFQGMKVSIHNTYDHGMLIYLPESLDTIGANAFQDTKTIRFLGNHIMFAGERAFHNSQLSGKMTIDSFAAYCFAGASDYSTRVTLLGTEIPDHAFDGAKMFFTAKNAVRTIGSYAFYNATVQASFEKGFEIIGSHAFDKANIKSLSFPLPENTTEIGDNAFSNNPELHEVVLPVSINAIGDTAFDKTVIKLQVTKGSYAEFWAQENGYSYSYAGDNGDNTDWLNN